MFEQFLDEMIYEWLNNEAWDQLTDWQLSQFADLEEVACMSVVHQWFAEYKGWA